MRLRGLVRGWLSFGLLAVACVVGRGQDKPVPVTMWKGEPLAHLSGGVSAPHVIHSVEPVFSESMRKELKYTRSPLVSLIVDKEGMPQDVHVVKSSGDAEIDSVHVEAVKQYRFSPAMENGKAVPVEISIEMDIRIF